MKNIFIITPHPDDETLGCGGTILKHAENGDRVYWIIITQMNKEFFSEYQIQCRQEEIKAVQNEYKFFRTIEFAYNASNLNDVNMKNLIEDLGRVFIEESPHIIYAPYRNDAHSDHRVTYDATLACTKWFRYPSIEKVLVYETLSETDFAFKTDIHGFQPNVFVNISDYIDKKVDILSIYKSEVANHPFPRSDEAIRALATLRGSACGVIAAEAFMLIKERIL